MHQENHYKTKLTINILIASTSILLLAVFIFNLQIPCIFNKIFHFRCIACGLTRSFKAILNSNFIEAFNQNIIGIPLFLTLTITYILYLIDLLFQKNNLTKLYENITKHYILIIISIIILTVLNNF